MDELKTNRKKEIVIVSVDEYIKNAQPITSSALQTHFPNISTATLRNELSALDAMGYFRQLHTSSGRVPTNMAYRVYVSHVIKSNQLSAVKLNKVHNDYENRSVSLISTLCSLAKRLSKATNCPTVLLQNGLENLVIENIQIIPLVNKDALLLVETIAGIIDDNIALDSNIERATCIEASKYLTSQFKGETIRFMVDNIQTVCLNAGSQILQFRSLIDNVMNALFKVVEHKIDISAESPSKILTNFTAEELDDAKDLLSVLEDDEKVIDLINEANSDELNFRIGGENSDDKLKSGMLMTAPIIINGVSIASLALVGPKRTDYASVAAALKFIVEQANNLKK